MTDRRAVPVAAAELSTSRVEWLGRFSAKKLSECSPLLVRVVCSGELRVRWREPSFLGLHV